MAKRSSKSTETREELSTTCNPKVMSRCLSAPDATSLHHYLQNIVTMLLIHWTQREPALGNHLNPFYPASAVLFQLHGSMGSYMQVLATPSSTVNNTNYLDPYHRNHISFSCLFLRQ